MNTPFIFFGSSRFSVEVLETLAKSGTTPLFIITVPDKPKGRSLALTPSEVAVWANEHGIPYIAPASLKTPETENLIRNGIQNATVALVASYGKIIPDTILHIPPHGTLNIHPSLLPKLRGASPLESAIITENETGVTLIELDSEMDHGPILAQAKITLEWPPYLEDLEKTLAVAGARMYTDRVESYISGSCVPEAQDHDKATFCGKFSKTDGHISFADSPEINIRKIRAFHISPGAYFLHTRGEKVMRVAIKRARLENNTLVLERVVPEGKKEMDYESFVNGYGPAF